MNNSSTVNITPNVTWTANDVKMLAEQYGIPLRTNTATGTTHVVYVPPKSKGPSLLRRKSQVK
jgi:hypothetical protein